MMNTTLQKPKIRKNKAQKLPLFAHLQELRFRVLLVVAVLLVGTGIGYLLFDSIVDFLVRPLGQPLYYSTPAGGFDFMVRVCLFFGFLLTLPFTIFQAFLFVKPSLKETTSRMLGIVFSSSAMLLLTGVCFAYYISLPAALLFLNTFTKGNIQSLISTDDYLSFVMSYLLGFGIVFQLPLVLLLINYFAHIRFSTLMSYQRTVIITSFVFAAIITPTPDPINMSLMALPIILLYELSVGCILLSNYKKT